VVVDRAEHRGGRSGAEREGGELAQVVLARRARLLEPRQRGLLGGLRVLAVDDDRVADLAGVDHPGRQGEPVDEAQAGVGDVEVEGGRRQPETVVDLRRDRRLEVGAGDGRVDQQPDVGGVHPGLRERLRPGGDGRLVERRPRVPPASLVDTGDPLQQPAREPQPPQGAGELVVEVGRGDDHRGFEPRDREESGAGVAEGGVAVHVLTRFLQGTADTGPRHRPVWRGGRVPVRPCTARAGSEA
jgi:hypothetical protein